MPSLKGDWTVLDVDARTFERSVPDHPSVDVLAEHQPANADVEKRSPAASTSERNAGTGRYRTN